MPSMQADRLKRSLFGVAAAIAIVTSFSARAENGVSAEKIVFGQAAALDGPAAALGQGMREGLLAAFAEANKAGGIKGRQIELISRDDGYDPNKSIQAAKQLIDQDKVTPAKFLG